MGSVLLEGLVWGTSELKQQLQTHVVGWVCVRIYIYMYSERKRERERGREREREKESDLVWVHRTIVGRCLTMLLGRDAHVGSAQLRQIFHFLFSSFHLSAQLVQLQVHPMGPSQIEPSCHTQPLHPNQP